MKQAPDWAWEHPRLAGAIVALSGSLIIWGSWLLQMRSLKILFVGLVLVFFGSWSILTRRIFHPRQRVPGWWILGALALVVMAFALAWRIFPP